MQIILLGDNLHGISSPISSEKNRRKKKSSENFTWSMLSVEVQAHDIVKLFPDELGLTFHEVSILFIC